MANSSPPGTSQTLCVCVCVLVDTIAFHTVKYELPYGVSGALLGCWSSSVCLNARRLIVLGVCVCVCAGLITVYC